MDTHIVRTTNQTQYNQIWRKNNGHFMQSWEWGEIKGNNSEIKRFLIIDSDEIVNIFTWHEKKVLKGIVKLAYIPKSKIPEKYFPDLRNLLKAYGIDCLVLEQDYAKQDGTRHEHTFDNIQPHQTNIIDLTFSEDQLWQNLDSKYRRNINKGKRHNLKIHKFTQGQEALNKFYQVLSFIIKNTNYVMYKEDYFQKVWINLSASGLAQIFVAETVEGELAGSYLLSYDNLGAYELYGGVNKLGRELEAGYLLKWNAILDAQQMNKRFYDHWGVAPKSGSDYLDSHELYHISKFKAGFGGNYVEFADSRIIFNSSLKYYLLRTINYSRKFKLRLLKILKNITYHYFT